MEAALLIEAGWENNLHEVWSCFIPEKEVCIIPAPQWQLI